MKLLVLQDLSSLEATAATSSRSCCVVRPADLRRGLALAVVTLLHDHVGLRPRCNASDPGGGRCSSSKTPARTMISCAVWQAAGRALRRCDWLEGAGLLATGV